MCVLTPEASCQLSQEAARSLCNECNRLHSQVLTATPICSFLCCQGPTYKAGMVFLRHHLSAACLTSRLSTGMLHDWFKFCLFCRALSHTTEIMHQTSSTLCQKSRHYPDNFYSLSGHSAQLLLFACIQGVMPDNLREYGRLWLWYGVSGTAISNGSSVMLQSNVG